MHYVPILGLIQNVALLLAVAFVFDITANRWQPGQTSYRQQLLAGAVLGFIGITVMLTPWTFVPGVVFDARSVLLGISGIFFGWLPVTIAMVMTASFRLYLAGTGAWTGVAVILASGSLGIAWRHFHRRPLVKLSWRELYLFGLALHATMLILMFTLPWETALRVLSHISLPVLVIYPLATAVFGMVMVNRLRRERAEQELAILAEIGRIIGSTLNIDEVYERFAAAAQILISFDRIAVNLNKPQENILWIAYVSGADVPGRRKGDSLPLKGSLNEFLMRTRAGLIIRPENSKDEFSGIYAGLVSTFAAGLHSLLSVPLISRDEVIGALHFRAKKPNVYTEQDLLLAEKIAAQIAGAIGNAQLFADLRITENLLRLSEGRFRGLVEQAAVGVAEILIEPGRFLTVNGRFCELVGRTEEELLATTFRAITHPEDLHLHEGKMAQLLAGEIGCYSLEKRYLKKDGESVWVNITVSPLRRPGERLERNMIVVEDITVRKRIEEELRRSKDVAERLAEEMAVIAEIGRVIGSSLNIEEVYERFAAETRKLIPFDNLMVNLKKSQLDTLEVAYSSGIPMPNRRVGDRFPLRGTIAETVMRTRAGLIQSLHAEEITSRFPAAVLSIQAGLSSVMGVPLIAQDEVIGALMIRSKRLDAYTEKDLRLAEKIGAQIAGAMANAQLFTDLKYTERSLRESEEKYRELVEFLPIVIFEIDAAGKIASFNDTARETFRYSTEDPITGMDAHQFFAPEESERLDNDMGDVMGGTSKTSVEYGFVRKDGTTFTGLIYASPIVRRQKCVGIRGAIIDITDRIKAMEELQEAKDRLIQSEKLTAIGRLATGVTHEILNPVNIISLALQILMKGNDLPPKVRQELAVCIEQIHRIVTIARGLNRFARTQRSKREMSDITAVVNHGLMLCMPQLKLKGVQTDIHYPADLPSTLMGRETIEQVIVNLITNAIAAMEGKAEKVLRIAITRETKAEQNDYLKIMIADTGTGIPEKDMTRLFEPFFTTKEPGRGTGLGLSISFGIIRDHGGRIWAENNEWGGASFFFEIPVTADEDGGSF